MSTHTEIDSPAPAGTLRAACGTRTVLVVDDHRTVADLLRIAIDADPELSCAGVAYDVATAARLAAQTQPDLVVTDVHFVGRSEDGIDLAEQLHREHPEMLVVLLTGDSRVGSLERVVRSGAAAFLAKDGDLPSLLGALRTVGTGSLHVDPRLLRILVAAAPAPTYHLSSREHEVLEMLAEGVDATGIARRLGITLNTCRGYIRSVLRKLEAHSQLEAVAIARRTRLLEVDRVPRPEG
ncbi:MAG: response regulator [Nocardioides sp.]